MKNNVIALSSKHWLKNAYIEIKDDSEVVDGKFVFGLWDIITQTSNTIGRELERYNKDSSYVYISNLSRDQTLKVYKELIKELQSRKLSFDVDAKWEMWGWNVGEDNTIHIPWIIPMKHLL
jgi:hypothetical protein